MTEEDLGLHPELAASGSFAHLKLGKRPRKNDPRTLRLEKYLRLETLPTIPDAHDWSTPVASWPMYGNDRLGDCTCAAAGHMVEAWTANANAPVVPADADVEGLYWATGSDDSGRFELDILNYWRTQGFGGDRIAAFVAVNPQASLAVRAGAFLFGGLYLGVALPLTAQGQAVWDIVGDGKSGSSAPGSWGGHAIDVVAYDAAGVTVVTWGALQRMTWAFWDAYVDEAYAIVTQDWISANGDAPSGFALESLLADLAQVEQTETPEGITVGDADEDSFRRTMPTFPYEFTLHDATYWIQRYPDGSFVLKFAPVQQVAGRGSFPIPPGVAIPFGADGWERFKKRVESDGGPLPEDEIARPASQIVVPGR